MPMPRRQFGQSWIYCSAILNDVMWECRKESGEGGRVVRVWLWEYCGVCFEVACVSCCGRGDVFFDVAWVSCYRGRGGVFFEVAWVSCYRGRGGVFFEVAWVSCYRGRGGVGVVG
ncbi:hypothetical protein Pmani_020758 [Petrolisthes manimaculis]|uniref:Uncharacterized protein n=1 Tax=Petrolisthes manimaculis TaxID=1843537 RepID=A0AAE1PHN0_9EUCA|nr:hypothetical protein Pmani_020758 [Petrolisthes manimaculis]